MTTMNIEFHYYAIYYLCACAGCGADKSMAIAMSSQMVDECRAPWRIVGSSAQNAAARPQDGAALTEVTQSDQFWDREVRETIYMPFHFVPGLPPASQKLRLENTAWPGNKASAFTVTPDSPLARGLLVAALRTANPYRIGIALHAYADSWAHQHFSGLEETGNALFPSSIVPAVGHMQAFFDPDDPSLVWNDPRLKPGQNHVDNPARFFDAARMIYRFLCTSLKRSFDDEVLILEPLVRIWRTQGRLRDTQARASDYIVDLDVPPYVAFDWASRAGALPPSGAQAARGAALFAAIVSTKAAHDRARPLGSIAEARYRASPLSQWDEAVRAHRAQWRSLYNSSLYDKRGMLPC